MAIYKVVKGELKYSNYWLCKFTQDLTSCVTHACLQVGRNISRTDSSAFGTEKRVSKDSGTPSSLAADEFADLVEGSHANAYARHLTSVQGKTTRMDLGNLVEQAAYARMKKYYTNWVENTHYVYQQPAPVGTMFLVDYRGTGAKGTGSRPDFRYSFYPGKAGGDEVVFDMTTTGQVGHLLEKKIGRGTIGTHAKIPIAIEIVWTDKEIKEAGSRRSWWKAQWHGVK